MKSQCMFAFLLLVFSLDFLAAQAQGDGVRQEWVARYNGPENKGDGSRAIAVDARGNVYVTGDSLAASSGSATIKYDPDGREVWVARYEGPTYAIAVDTAANVYVAGQSSRNNGDYLTIKYDSEGKEVWKATYAGPGNSGDVAWALALDAAGNVYVTGSSWGDNRSDFGTIKYDPTGNEVWVARYHGPTMWGLDGAAAIAVDARGNVYVTGRSGYSNTFDYATIKYDPQGNEVWVARYNGPQNLTDIASAIAIDPAGNVYVTGESAVIVNRFGTTNDFATIKYDPDGHEVWVARYNAPGPESGLGGNDDQARAIALDDRGNVYVTGTSGTFDTHDDYATIKYDRNGNQVWVARYNSLANGSDGAAALALDAVGNVYVTGGSQGDFATIKYGPDGREVWVARYNGPANGSDGAAAIALDAVGNVYVAGGSQGDFATIKYSQSPPPTFVRSLFFPRLVTDSNQFTGIAIVNLDTSAATLRFTAFERTGSAVNGSNISNPATRTLNPGSQIPIMDAQVFGEGLTSSRPVGWIKVESTVQKITGFFLTLDPALTVLDGADVSSRTLTSFVLPEIETGRDEFTQIHIANPNASSTQTILELVRADGSVRAKTGRTIGANGSLADMLTDLFPGITPSSSDYMRATASQGVVAFEFLGRSGRFVQGLNGQNTASGATTLYSPQYVVGGPTWMTTLSVVNQDDTSGTVTFRFIGNNGAVIGTQQRQIAPRGKFFISEQSFFSSAANQTQGYVEINSSGPRLAGSVVFGDQGRSTFSSALPLVSNLHKEMIFGQVASAEASSPSWFTGLALLNAGSADANAVVQVFDENGALVESGNFVVPARRRLSQLLTQYFPDLAGRDILKGYIRVTTDQPLASFALFGTTSLSVLSAVPPQLVP